MGTIVDSTVLLREWNVNVLTKNTYIPTYIHTYINVCMLHVLIRKVSNHHEGCFKYLTILYVSHTSKKLERKKGFDSMG